MDQRLSFSFHDQDSLTDFGVYLVRWPVLPAPKRRVHFVEIPGRSSTLWYDEKTYEDYTILVDCAVSRSGLQLSTTAFIDHLDLIQSWLYPPVGEQGIGTLTFSFQPGKEHLAQVIQPVDFHVVHGRVALFTVPFTCKADGSEGT